MNCGKKYDDLSKLMKDNFQCNWWKVKLCLYERKIARQNFAAIL